VYHSLIQVSSFEVGRPKTQEGSLKFQVVFVILIESAKGGEEKNLNPQEILLPINRDQDDKWVGSE
jgi:hypothetical protein